MGVVIGARHSQGRAQAEVLPRPDAVLLDVDGTLVDSNYLHVQAWSRACLDVERAVPSWRVHRAIGMDSTKLVSALLGDDAHRLGHRVKARHAEHYQDLSGLLQPLPGARELVHALSSAGVEVVLATSASPDELERLRSVLDIDVDLTAVTDADDVATAKPAPDIVSVALARAGVGAERALFVGDATWDVEAAGKAGVPCVAVRTGGVGVDELRTAGAAGVYDDAADLLAAVSRDPVTWLRLA